MPKIGGTLEQCSAPCHWYPSKQNNTGCENDQWSIPSKESYILGRHYMSHHLLRCFSLVFLHGLPPFAGRTSRYLLNQQPSANGEPWSSIIQSTGVTSSGLWSPTIGGYAFELSTVPTPGPDVIRLKSLSYVHCWAGLPSDRRSHDAPGWYFCKYNG